MQSNLLSRVKRSENPIISRTFLLARSVYLRYAYGKREYYSIPQEVSMALEMADRLPNDYDVVVGIPRSGLIFANVMAVKWGRPLSTPDLLASGVMWHSKSIARPEVKRVLLVDDSIDTGMQLAAAKALIEDKYPGVVVETAAPLVRRPGAAEHFHSTADRMMLEVHVAHLNQVGIATDMDGVLCEDCPVNDNDEAAYRQWLVAARPKYLPSYELEAIVTNRIEKYRPETEQWLKDHNVRYRRLLMCSAPSNAERDKKARSKVGHLLRLKPELFIESNWKEAREIYKRTRITTLCVDRNELLGS